MSVCDNVSYLCVISICWVAAIRLYKNVIAKFKSNEGWSKDIKCNIRVKQGFPLSPTLFGIYIDKLEVCLEEAGCAGTFLAGIVIILLLYANDIVLLARSPYDIDKKLWLLKDLCSTMGMTVNTNKTKVMIIKSKKDTYANFVCMTIVTWRNCLPTNT